jgi:CRP-like cAMP-binding protein
MRPYLHLLRQLRRESRYVVNERTVATAIMTRAKSRLSGDRADVGKQLDWFDHQLNQVPAEVAVSAAAAPVRSRRRASARRASSRRATARKRGQDIKAYIIQFLVRHPESTAGDLAKALNLDRGTVSRRLAQLARAGEIKKAAHGYSA